MKMHHLILGTNIDSKSAGRPERPLSKKGKSEFISVEDWINQTCLSDGLAGTAQVAMLQHRNDLPLYSKIGTFPKFRMSYTPLSLIRKVGGPLSLVGDGINMYMNYQDYKRGEISLERFSYCATGTSSSIIANLVIGAQFGGPYGAASGLFISSNFWLYEIAYDAYSSWKRQASSFFSNYEIALRNGWIPR